MSLIFAALMALGIFGQPQAWVVLKDGVERDKLASQAQKYHCTDISTVDAGGRIYPMFAIPISKLALWLASINPNKIPDPAVREKLELYQAESAIALHDYWTRGLALNRQRLDSDEEAREAAYNELRKSTPWRKGSVIATGPFCYWSPSPIMVSEYRYGDHECQWATTVPSLRAAR